MEVPHPVPTSPSAAPAEPQPLSSGPCHNTRRPRGLWSTARPPTCGEKPFGLLSTSSMPPTVNQNQGSEEPALKSILKRAVNMQGDNFHQQTDEVQLWLYLCLTQTLLYQLPYDGQVLSSHRSASPTQRHTQCFANAQGQTDKQSHRDREKPSISYDTCFNNTKHLISCFSSAESGSGKELLYLHGSQQL